MQCHFFNCKIRTMLSVIAPIEHRMTQAPNCSVLKHLEGDLFHKPTLPRVLIRLVVDKVGHTAAVMQPLLVVEGFERLAGAVRLLSRHAALVGI